MDYPQELVIDFLPRMLLSGRVEEKILELYREPDSKDNIIWPSVRIPLRLESARRR